MDDRRQLTIGAAGTGAKSWVLPGSYQIAGIRIDNPSGSWLALPDGTFVPPYTLGFGHSFQPMLSRIDVLFSAGPAGQLSTQQGDKPTVVIYSEPVGEAPGVPSGQGTAFIQQFTPIQVASVLSLLATLNGASQTIVAATANKRIRMHTFSVYTAGASVSTWPHNSGWSYGFISITTFVGFGGHLYYPKMDDMKQIELDFPVGEGITFSATADWADVTVNCDITFSLI